MNEALFEAARRKHFESVKLYLICGADPNTKGFTGGSSAINYASEAEETERVALMTLLLASKADPNNLSDQGFPPLVENLEYPDIVEMLCKAGANVNYCTNDGNSLLHQSIALSQLKTVEVLLKYKADPNCRNIEGDTPLIFTMRQENVFNNNQELRKSFIAALLAHGADPNLKNLQGYTALMMNTRFPAIAELLCQKGAKVNHQESISSKTALHLSVENNQYETAEVLLKYRADPNLKDLKGQTALNQYINFSIEKRIEWTMLLLKYGADYKTVDLEGWTPLIRHADSVTITKLMCKLGVNVNQQYKNGYTALHLAIHCGKLASAKVLLKHQADPNLKNADGDTPLNLPLNLQESDKVKAFALLLEHGADPNLVNHRGLSPLMRHIESEAIADLFYQFGVDLNLQTFDEGHSALHLAIKNRRSRRSLAVLKSLLKRGALLNLADKKGLTPLCLGVSSWEITQFLCQSGAHVNHQTQDGSTALHLAVECNALNSVKILLEYQADFSLKNLAGKTAYELALESSKPSIISAFKEFIAHKNKNPLFKIWKWERKKN